jgi:hypothetical protein
MAERAPANASPLRLAIGIGLALACFVVAIALQMVRDRAYSRDQAQERSVMYVRSGPALRRIVLSFDALAADLYWIRAVQHYGGDRRSRTKRWKYELLHPILDLTTELDPYFTIAYRFGAIFLSEPYPSGAGRSDLANALLRKGIAAQPTKWQYYHDVAFVYYWQLRDMNAAAEWFRKAAAQPGAPNWLEPVAATMLVQGGDRPSARLLLQQIQKSEEPWLQHMATRSLMQIDVLDFADAMRPAIRANPPPPGEQYSWQWLIRRGIVKGIFTDQTGVPLEVDPASGEITVSRQSELYPMPATSPPQ